MQGEQAFAFGPSQPDGCEVLHRLSPAGEALAVHDRRRDRLGVAWLLPPELFAENATALAEALAGIHHPAMAQHLGLTWIQGQPALLCEALPPCTLRDHLEAHGPLPEPAALQLALRLCDALIALHDAKLVHGALSAEAVYLAPPEVWLADLRGAHFDGDVRDDLAGLARVLEAAVEGAVSEPMRPLLARLRGERDGFADVRAAHAGLLAAADALGPGDTWPSLPPRSRPPAEPTACEREGDRVGSYVLQRLLGEGSMGRVFAAQHVRLARQVALKILKPEHARAREVVQRLFQEARTVNEIDHEHIVEIFDFVEEQHGEGEVRAYCVMELLEGRSLAELLREGPLPLARAVGIARQLCQALGAAHRVGVVHRDVKPDNVFVIERGGADFVKVVDFGIAKLERPMGELPTGTTLDGAIIGTPSYMSPEQASGLPVDHRADLHALGVVLYEMLTGTLPFGATRFGALAAQIISQPAPPLPAKTNAGEPIPPALAQLVARLLAKDPRARPASAEIIERALERACEKAPRRHASRWLLLGATAAALGGLAIWHARVRPAVPANHELAAKQVASPPVSTSPSPQPRESPKPTELAPTLAAEHVDAQAPEAATDGAPRTLRRGRVVTEPPQVPERHRILDPFAE